VRKKTKIIPKLSEKDLVRFWAKVDIRNGNEYDEWGGSKDKDGYGIFWLNGKNYRAHRIAYILANGQIPDGKFVLHCCDNPGCPKADHFFLGTTKDNMQDARTKGRLVTGDKHWSRMNPEKLAYGDRNGSRLHPEKLARGERSGSRTHPESRPRRDTHWSRLNPEKVARGERNGNGKLTECKVLEIRKRCYEGETQVSVAKRFKVSIIQVSRIVRGKAWTHLQNKA